MKKYLSLLIYPIFASMLLAQHENCNHGDAPSLESNSNGKYIHTTDDALNSIGFTSATVISKKFDSVVCAIGRIENIPENIDCVTSRVSGRVVEVFVKRDSFVKSGSPICKVESFLAGNPPPSVILKSRKSGVVEILNVFNGSGVEAGSEIARVVDTSELYAVANVFESAVSQIKVGDSARIKIEALGDEIIVDGVLVKIGASLDAQTNTLPAYFLIKNIDGKIKNGMRAIFNIVTKSKESLTVPVEAVSLEDGLNYVYVQSKHDSGIFERRLITTNAQNDIDAEIKKGLTQGEKVAVKGIYQLRFFPRNNDPHNHSASHQQNDSHNNEHLDEDKTKECKDKSHNHLESEHKLVQPSHEHSQSEHGHIQDTHKHSQSEHEHSADSSFGLEYRQNLFIAMLVVSILLNLAFAVAHFVVRRKSK